MGRTGQSVVGLQFRAKRTLAELLQRLKRREEAKAALRKGVEWMEERKRQAEDNALLRSQYESVRPALDALRREAEDLLNGKDVSSDRAA